MWNWLKMWANTTDRLDNNLKLQDASNSSYQKSAYEDAKLAELWNVSDKSSVVFVGLDIHTSDDNPKWISEISQSAWSFDRRSKVAFSRWKIQRISERKAENGSALSSCSDFEGSLSVTESEIGILLAEKLKWLESIFPCVCIVGYGICSTLPLLRNLWTSSETMRVVDLRKVWQFQANTTEAPTLRRCLESSSGTAWNGEMFGDDGNDARYIIQLLQVLGMKTENRVRVVLGAPPSEISNNRSDVKVAGRCSGFVERQCN
jgi:hypothetical protein